MPILSVKCGKNTVITSKLLKLGNGITPDSRSIIKSNGRDRVAGEITRGVATVTGLPFLLEGKMENLISKASERLNEINEQYEKDIEVLADQVRKTLIIPICREHKLDFISGNGIFTFRNEKDIYIDSEKDAKQYGMEFLIPVLDLLNKEWAYNQLLGFMVTDVFGAKRP